MVKHGSSVGKLLLTLVTAAFAVLLLQDPVWAQTTGLSITKQGPARVEPGAGFQYILTVTNNGATPVDVTVTDRLPTGVGFRGFEGDGGCLPPPPGTSDEDNRITVTCTINGLAAGESAEIRLRVTAPNSVTQLVNVARADDDMTTDRDPADTTPP